MTEASAQKSPEKTPRAAISLTPRARQVHQWILVAFAETGRALRRGELEDLARAHGIEPGPALAELRERDLLAFDGQGEIRAAYPFSPSLTSIRVSWAGGPDVYAMCAIDALGMSAMLGRPVTISAAEPGTERAITVEVDRDQAHWSPRRAVVFSSAADGASCAAADRSCGYINFFTSARAARTWARQHPAITGETLDQARALRRGIAEFGTLMRPAESGNGMATGL
jgi:Alkylmercury lyase